jgi:hypothetical protein
MCNCYNFRVDVAGVLRVLTSQSGSSSVLTASVLDNEASPTPLSFASSVPVGNHSHNTIPLPRGAIGAETVPWLAAAVGGMHVAVVCASTGEATVYAWRPDHHGEQHKEQQLAGHFRDEYATEAENGAPALAAISKHAASLQVGFSGAGGLTSKPPLTNLTYFTR